MKMGSASFKSGPQLKTSQHDTDRARSAEDVPIYLKQFNEGLFQKSFYVYYYLVVFGWAMTFRLHWNIHNIQVKRNYKMNVLVLNLESFYP